MGDKIKHYETRKFRVNRNNLCPGGHNPGGLGSRLIVVVKQAGNEKELYT